jgi:hypothetical protein
MAAVVQFLLQRQITGVLFKMSRCEKHKWHKSLGYSSNKWKFLGGGSIYEACSLDEVLLLSVSLLFSGVALAEEGKAKMLCPRGIVPGLTMPR